MGKLSLTEINTVVKDIRDVDVLIGYCYPSTYRAGMTSLATHLFYSSLNRRKNISCERYFRYDTYSPIRSVETKRHLKDNHLIGFSLSFEEDILHVVQMLSEANIPHIAANRMNEDPIVIMGGPVVSANPCPYELFIDAFVIGEGDLVFHSIADCILNSESRQDALGKMAELQGVYVPSIKKQPIKRQIMQNLDELFHPTKQIIPDVPEGAKLEPVFGKALLVEVGRGCGHSCKFCLVGHICRPRRLRSFEKLKEIITKGINETPVRKVAFIAPTLGDLPEFEQLVEWCIERDLEISAPSLRADSISRKSLDLLMQGGQRTLTIAPETGSSRLRNILGKGLTDEAILKAVKLAADAKWYSIKLYFIIGLPYEDEKDILAITNLSKQIAEIFPGKITISANPFVPKANTRFERNAQSPIYIIREKIRTLEQGINNIPRVTVETLDPRHARIQASLSLGDKKMGEIIKIAASYGGLGGWRRAEKETGLPFFAIANNRERLKGPLPWKFIQ
ncbi:MAG: radical SAM protein [Candidatus Lokiarchaeota archaeon]|nr:radical SAM protein [Candidatus Lokiarchaeota archaeon]